MSVPKINPGFGPRIQAQLLLGARTDHRPVDDPQKQVGDNYGSPLICTVSPPMVVAVDRAVL